MEKNIKLAYLYPDILNLHGDRGNILAFERVAKMMNIPLEVIRINNPLDKLMLNEFDIVIFSPGELKVIEALTKALLGYKEDIKDFIESDKYMIALGTSVALFGKEVKREDRPSFNGLEIADFSCEERKWVYGDDIIFSFDNTEITACQIQMININLADESKKLASVKYGMGNNNKATEGYRQKNLILTNALGPVFVKNPWWARDILLDIAKRKDINYSLDNMDFSLEEASKKATDEFILNK